MKITLKITLKIMIGCMLTACHAVETPRVTKTPKPQEGLASYYSVRTNGGTKTASGKPLCDRTPSAAHPSLPFGTIVKVTRVKTGKTTEVPITDRGPFTKGRILDLNLAAARALGITPKDGIAKVKVQVVKKPTTNKK